MARLAAGIVPPRVRSNLCCSIFAIHEFLEITVVGKTVISSCAEDARKDDESDGASLLFHGPERRGHSVSLEEQPSLLFQAAQWAHR